MTTTRAFTVTTTRAFTVLLAALALVACDTTTDPSQGSINVTASTTGDDIDPDGYLITVGASQQTLAANGDTVTFTGFTSGEIYAVTISDLADNCDPPPGGDTQSAPVVFGPPTEITFSITCVAVP